MTYKEFLEKYPVGTKVDFDKRYGEQCVDLFREYALKVWGITSYDDNGIGGIVGAKDLWLGKVANIDRYLDKIPKGSGVPGDIAIFDSTPSNKFGHVAVFTGYDANGNICVIEQDGFQAGMEKAGVKKNVWRPDRLLGFLRKKVS